MAVLDIGCARCTRVRLQIEEHNVDLQKIARYLNKGPAPHIVKGQKTLMAKIKAKRAIDRQYLEEHNCGGEE